MSDLAAKNKRILTTTLAVAVFMVALVFASVPIYRLTCQAFGWGGTTQVSAERQEADRVIGKRTITVKFVSNTARDMPWDFKPELREVALHPGQDGFISFIAHNPTQTPITGTALYNVTPLKAGKYFYKTQCFCFGEQVLAPGESQHMPVAFFIDPAIEQDSDLDDVTSITLSYTFFRKDSKDLENALEKFYNDDGS